jgi:hypothetical protein
MRVDQTSDKLLRAQRTAENSEQIGREILGALDEDRQVLDRAKGKVCCLDCLSLLLTLRIRFKVSMKM